MQILKLITNLKVSYRLLIIVITAIAFIGLNPQILNFFKYSDAATAINYKISDFLTFMTGILIEATPFVILGTLISTIINRFFNSEKFLNYLPKNTFLSHIILAVSGIFLPVCECGNVPLARRLISKGFKISHVITFLLAAPIINPITIWSTLTAFNFLPEVAYLRVAFALIISVVAGLLFSLAGSPEELLNDEFYDTHCKLDHDHGKENFSDIFLEEFAEVFKMLLIGSLIAAAFQTFIPRSIIIAIGSDLLTSIIAMITLAFVISICSNVDAFFALSFYNAFPLGSLISFLVFGPMIDIKMLTMLSKTFKLHVLIKLSTFILLMSIISGLVANLIL